MDFLFSEFCRTHILGSGWENLSVSQGRKLLVASSRPMLTCFVPWLTSTIMLLRVPLCSAEDFGVPPACFDNNPKCAQSQAHCACIKLCSPKVCITLQAAVWSGFSDVAVRARNGEQEYVIIEAHFTMQTSDSMPQRVQWEASKIPSEGLVSQVP